MFLNTTKGHFSFSDIFLKNLLASAAIKLLKVVLLFSNIFPTIHIWHEDSDRHTVLKHHCVTFSKLAAIFSSCVHQPCNRIVMFS